jgi:hypothetical protein
MKNEENPALLRLDPDVLTALEVIGPYWDVQANEVLRQVFVSKLRWEQFEVPIPRPRPGGLSKMGAEPAVSPLVPQRPRRPSLFVSQAKGLIIAAFARAQPSQAR